MGITNIYIYLFKFHLNFCLVHERDFKEKHKVLVVQRTFKERNFIHNNDRVLSLSIYIYVCVCAYPNQILEIKRYKSQNNKITIQCY